MTAGFPEGVNVSTATINRWSEIVYEKLETTEADILTRIKNSPVKHADESGCRVMAQTQWLHSASTKKLTYYTISAQRKTPFIDFIGIMVHDHWKNYFKIRGVLHALCNQHHLRELQSLIENEKEPWAKDMQRCLRLGLQYRHKHGDEPIPEDIQRRYLNLYDSIVDKGIAFHESLSAFSTQKKRGRQAKRTGHNLLLRFKNYRDDVLRFFTKTQVPFTNNQAERDIRMIKCKQKISGGFRSLLGAQIFLRIRGFISTVHKHGLSIFQAIQNTLQGLTSIIL